MDRPNKIDYDFDCNIDKNAYYIDLENYADYAEVNIAVFVMRIQNEKS